MRQSGGLGSYTKILEGAKLAVEKGWREVEIELDSSVVIEQIKGGASFWRLKTLLANIATIATRVEKINWKAIPRGANECVDGITKQARNGVRLND